MLDANFIKALLHLITPHMTGNNSGATDVDLLKNDKLSEDIRSLFKANANIDQSHIDDLKRCIYHTIKGSQIAQRLSSIEDQLKVDEEKEQDILGLIAYLKKTAQESVTEYIADFDIRTVLGKDANYFDTLITFIGQESDRAKTILSRIAACIILPKCYVQNAKVIAALPYLVGDRGVEFYKHFKDEEFVTASYRFVDDKAAESMVSFSSWTIVLELTRTTRQIVITDDSGQTHFRLMF